MGRRGALEKKIIWLVVSSLMVAALVLTSCVLPPTEEEKEPVTPPAAPTITSPGSSSEPGSVVDTLTPTLQWNAVSGADYYVPSICKYPYGSGNVSGLGNFYLCLFAPDCGLWMELPTDAALFTTIGNAGITADSLVVVIGRTVEPYAPYAVADAARVAITLIYAGVENVALLSGGYDKWAAEGRATSTEPVTPTAVAYTGVADAAMFVTMSYVANKVGEEGTTLVEGREADIYYGIIQEPWTTRAGHIPTAKNLPAPWFWATTVDEAGVTTYITWKDTSAITEMATTVLGNDGDEEIISYCGVGGYTSPVWYVLTQVVGYRNVKLYDGSMQEWSAGPTKDVIKYKYE